MFKSSHELSVESAVFPTQPPALTRVLLEADPEALEIELKGTAVAVVDMQNAFVSKGGMLDLIGTDISLAQKIIETIIRITSTARANGVKVIYVAHRYSPDLRESGGPNSSYWHKERALRLYRSHPEWRDKLLLRGTWGAEIIEELKPKEDDIVVEKLRFSAFFGTNLARRSISPSFKPESRL